LKDCELATLAASAANEGQQIPTLVTIFHHETGRLEEPFPDLAVSIPDLGKATDMYLNNEGPELLPGLRRFG